MEDQGISGFLVLDAIQDEVPFVFGLSLEIALGGELFLPLCRNRHMEMGGSARIRGWLDCPEEIPSLGIRHKSPVSLEVGIHFFPAPSSRVQVYTFSVHLPKFNGRMAQWVAFGVRDLATEVGDRPYGWSKRIVYDYKVVVRIQRQLVREERSRCLRRSQGELFGHETGGGEKRGKLKAFTEEVAASEYVHSPIMSLPGFNPQGKNGINRKILSIFEFVLHCEE